MHFALWPNLAQAVGRRNLVEMTSATHGEFGVRVTHMPNAESPPFVTPLPTQMWSHGWILVLKPPAPATYIFLRLIGARRGHPVAIDQHDRKRTGLSEDTITRGIRQLRELGIVDQRPAVIEDRYVRRRAHRRAYLVDDDRIGVDTITEAPNTSDKWDLKWVHPIFKSPRRGDGIVLSGRP